MSGESVVSLPGRDMGKKTSTTMCCRLHCNSSPKHASCRGFIVCAVCSCCFLVVEGKESHVSPGVTACLSSLFAQSPRISVPREIHSWALPVALAYPDPQETWMLALLSQCIQNYTKGARDSGNCPVLRLLWSQSSPPQGGDL
jgi:hypothetical protein